MQKKHQYYFGSVRLDQLSSAVLSVILTGVDNSKIAQFPALENQQSSTCGTFCFFGEKNLEEKPSWYHASATLGSERQVLHMHAHAKRRGDKGRVLATFEDTGSPRRVFRLPRRSAPTFTTTSIILATNDK